MNTKTRHDAEEAVGLIRRIIAACPRRLAGTESERRAQELLQIELEGAGATVELRPFEWNQSLYATMALHFAVGTLGTVIWFLGHPLLAFPLHLVSALSYFGDSTRRFYWLRRLLPTIHSQNLIARIAPTGEIKRRLVFVGHIDAAYTGWVFHPDVIRHATKEIPIPGLGWLRKSMLTATGATFFLAVLDLFSLAMGPSVWLPAVMLGMTIPAFLTFALNMQVVLKDEVVPGANDNLTACTATVPLARRLSAHQPDDLELIFVATGCEEAGTGGAYRLMESVSAANEWPRESTLVLGIDGLTNGELRVLIDGEIILSPPKEWLLTRLLSVAASEPRFAQVAPFEIPTGGTDAMPFLAAGYTGVTLGCVDPYIGAPRNYHRPSDTPDNLDVDQLALSLDYLEACGRNLMETDWS